MGSGTYTSALAYGGSADSDMTESWNGTAWTAAPNMSTGRGGANGAAGADNTSGLAVGVNVPTKSTEEFDSPAGSTREFDLS